MLQKMYSVRDSKAEIFNPPFFGPTHGAAERNFEALVNDQTKTPGQYPDDFDLYYLGDYDDNTGKISPLDTPQHLVKAVQLIRKN